MASDFKTVWNELEAGVSQIFQNNRENIVEETASDWLRMYTTVLTYCTTRSQDTKFNIVPMVRGKDIYENLKTYLVAYLEQINISKHIQTDNVENAEKYIANFMTEWKIYYTSIQKLNRIFNYIVKE